jgi:hypothetical protein
LKTISAQRKSVQLAYKTLAIPPTICPLFKSSENSTHTSEILLKAVAASRDTTDPEFEAAECDEILADFNTDDDCSTDLHIEANDKASSGKFYRYITTKPS